MLGHPAARPETESISETEVVSAQTVPPSLAAPVGGSLRPSAFMGNTETTSGYPLPARREAVTAVAAPSDAGVSFPAMARVAVDMKFHIHIQSISIDAYPAYLYPLNIHKARTQIYPFAVGLLLIPAQMVTCVETIAPVG